MKNITNEELQNYSIKGRGRSSNVFNAILNLEPGKNLLIEKDDWKKRYPVSRLSSYIGKKYKRKFKTWSVIGGGAIVSRIE